MYVLRIKRDGNRDKSFRATLSSEGRWPNQCNANALALQPDGRIIVGGQYQYVNGVSRRGIARLNRNGTLDSSFGSGDGANGRITCMALQPDGKLVIGGSFTAVGGKPCSYVARLLGDSP